MVAGWGGIPVLWSGDELGQRNDPGWALEPGHEDDNRWAHRPRLDWDRAAGRGDLGTTQGKVFQGLAHLARVQLRQGGAHAGADSRVLTDTDDGILAVVREHPSGPMVAVYNVTGEWRPFAFAELTRAGIARPVDALGGHAVYGGADGTVLLSPYAAWWVVDAGDLPGPSGSSSEGAPAEGVSAEGVSTAGTDGG